MSATLFGNITVWHYLMLSILLFSIGLCGALTAKKSIINIIMSFELILMAVNLNFIAFSNLFRVYDGQIFSIFVLTVAAAEAAVGLAILIAYNRNKGDISINKVNLLRG